MQMNGKLRTVRNLRAIWTALLFALVGLVFAGIGVYLFVGKPTTESGDPVNPLWGILLITVGALVALIAVIAIIRAVKSMRNSKPLSEEEVKANEEKFHAGAPEMSNLVDTKLFFHFGGKLNQSYFVEDKEGKNVYECRLKKFNPFGANTFEFFDVAHNYAKEVKIGKTVTSSADGGLPFVGDVLSSRFKIDGVMCWDYLRQRGYDIKHFMFDRNFIRYELYKLGKHVADIIPCNIKKPWDETNGNVLMMVRGAYRLEIFDARLEDVVMAAFIAAQSEIVE